MSKSSFAAYSLQDILKSEQFFVNLMECSKISRTEFEASFCAYGNQMRHNLTIPIKEERDRCLGGEKGGIVYYQEGHGLWMPEGMDKIVDVHFHPSHSAAVPSIKDMKSLIDHRNKPEMGDGMKMYGFNLTDIIGHTSGKEHTLFLTQERLDRNPTSDFVSMACSVIRDKFGDHERDLDFSDKELPYRVAKYLSSTKKYVATAIVFNSFKEYSSKISGLKGFELGFSMGLEKWMKNSNSVADSRERMDRVKELNDEDMRRLEEDIGIPSPTELAEECALEEED